MIPAISGFLNKKINTQLFYGYDITIGYIQAIDDVLKVLKQMIDNSRVLEKIKTILERERVQTVREMGKNLTAMVYALNVPKNINFV